MEAMDHIRALAQGIGPRGSTTPGEAEAARYAARMLRDMGLTPVTERFRSARSAWYPYALFAALMLLCEMLFWKGGTLGGKVAFAVALIVFVSILLELSFRSNPLRWILPKGESQNVWATVAPKKEMREQVILLGHLDTHRTPLVFSSDGWVKFFKSLVPIGLISGIALLVLFGVNIFRPDWTILQFISFPFSFVVFVLFLVTIQADFTPYNAGANDNASGAGVVLSLAEKLKTEPLDHTAVHFVLSGCEEVACYGAEAFARKHRTQHGHAIWFALDGLGARQARPCYLRSETFLLTTHSDPRVLELAGTVASNRPELGARPARFVGAYTEGAIGGKYGYRVITLMAIRDDGVFGEWHRSTDTVENVDPDTVKKCEQFTRELLQEIDRRAGEGVPAAR